MDESTKAALIAVCLSATLQGMSLGLEPSASKTPAIGRLAIAAALFDKDKKDKHACKGQNSCKGNGGCKSGDNGCKGKNSCKGKGGCAERPGGEGGGPGKDGKS